MTMRECSCLPDPLCPRHGSEDLELLDELPPSPATWTSLTRRQAERIATTLRENPGRWIRYPREMSNPAARQLAARINRGRIGAFKEGFEAVSRKGSTYVRYVGVAQEAQQ